MATDTTKLLFSSDFRYERISLKSSVPFSVTGGGFATINIPHGLSYKPYVKLFYRFGTGPIYPMFAGPGSFNIAGNNFQIEFIAVNLMNITVELGNYSGGTISGRIYYRIYEEPIT